MKQNIGLALKPPKEKCADVKCAWHGRLPVRGKVIEGIVRSAKPRNTAIVEWDYHRLLTKYERYARSKSRVNAHNPSCMHAKEGDRVIIAECRPLSKTKSFVVVSIEQAGAKIFFASEQEKKSEKEMRKEKQPPAGVQKKEDIESMFKTEYGGVGTGKEK